MNPLNDFAFLKKLDRELVKTYYTKILVLDKNEIPLRSIEGRVSGGSISVNGNSSVRRSGNISFIAEENENDLTDIDNLLSLNKKIQILIGIENNIDSHYDDIIWFKQGIFIITSPSISHNNSGVTINLQFKDKMCLLNGDCGGNLPTSVVFGQYDQLIGSDKTVYPSKAAVVDPRQYIVYNINGKAMMWDPEKTWYDGKFEDIGERLSIEQRIFDIILTLVCNYGGEDIAKIIINDVPLEIRNSIRNGVSETLWYNPQDMKYSRDKNIVDEKTWIPYEYNEDCGYRFTDFVYPGDLTSSIGDNVCTILDKIVNQFGNYEYYYDVEGNFIFQEKKNYLNTQYDPVQNEDKTRTLATGGDILNNSNYFLDFSNTSAASYTFDEEDTLISSYTNTPNYLNIKNDFHIWGKRSDDSFPIHYHIAIKEKPVFSDADTFSVVYVRDKEGEYNGKVRLAMPGETPDNPTFTVKDWRAYLYMLGLEESAQQRRPDIYKQELLDLFDDIYDMKEQKWKVDIINNPNDLFYWFDYIEPVNELYNISVENIGTRVYSYQKDDICKMYTVGLPNVVLINSGETPQEQIRIRTKCEDSGQSFSYVSENIFNDLALGTIGISAQDVARELLYQYTDFNSGISLTTVPIYYLEPNTRITVQDRRSNIFGDFVINSINVPLDPKNTMSISASRALNRV